MRTTGIALGPEAATTARCDLQWTGGRGYVKVLVVGVDDPTLRTAVADAERAAVTLGGDAATAARWDALLAAWGPAATAADVVTVDLADARAAWALAPPPEGSVPPVPWLVADGLAERMLVRQRPLADALVACLVARAVEVGLADVDGGTTATPVPGSLAVLHV